MSEKYKVRDNERAYFMTITVVDWVDVFAKENNRQVIIESLKFCQQSKDLEIFAWCLMSNHLHLIARANGRYTLPEIIRDFKKFTAKKIINLIMENHGGRREWMLQRFKSAADKIKRGHQKCSFRRNRFSNYFCGITSESITAIADDLYGNLFWVCLRPF